MTTADVDRIYAVNIRGVHLCYKFSAMQMIKQGTGGKLIAACSLAGYRASSFVSSYVTSKVSSYRLASVREPQSSPVLVCCAWI